MVLIPGPGIAHLPWGNQTLVPQLLSLRTRGRAPQEELPQWEARAPQREKALSKQPRPSVAKDEQIAN